MQYHPQLLSDDATDLLQRSVSAVFLVAIAQDCILVTRNERGWDIQGGHLEAGEFPLEAGEFPLEALRREVREEAGAEFGEAFPVATLSTTACAPVMLLNAADSFQLGALTLSGDIFGRDVIPAGVFLSHYHGDRALMQAILDAAVQHLQARPRETPPPGAE